MKNVYRLGIAAAALGSAMGTPVFAQDASAGSRAAEIEQLRAEFAALQARIDALEAELEQARTAAPAPAVPAVATPPAPGAKANEVAWKGAPQIENEDGWSFKPRGRLMYDAGFTDAPESTGRDDGFGNEVRRARLGVQGDMPGGFGYKFEFDFAGNAVDVADAIITYDAGPVELTVGHHNNFQSLEELTSSLHTTFIERAAFTDAFNFQRRIGASATYSDGIVLAQAGLFTDNFDETGSDNYGASGRFVLMPQIGDAQAHFGGSIHYNELGTPGDTVRYRQRPLVHFTSERFINTGNIGADSEFGYGLEAAIIAGPFHAAAEGFWQHVDRSGILADPTFFGAYAEAGIFLTGGDTRGYKNGKFDRVKPSSPVGEGGFGSVQFNLRYDYLDLSDTGILGGQQNGYFASLIWKPTDYTALMVNYGKLAYDDAVFPTATGDTSYDVDAFGVRAQIDF